MAALTLQAEAYAFRQLVEHLQWRTDVQNIDLMNLAGFCRNCLSKWYLAGSQVYGMPMDYDKACTRVYGEPYGDWKKKHQAKATEEQLKVYNDDTTKRKHARTDPKPLSALTGLEGPAQSRGGHSSVCGQDCEVAAPQAVVPAAPDAVSATIAVLTCSDRAAKGTYQDKSGPAIVEAVTSFASRDSRFDVRVTDQKIVPDDEALIQQQLQDWSSRSVCDVIFTTGGTGFTSRDVTPEATKPLIVRSADGLARAMSWQTSFQEPRSILSRSQCGITSTNVQIVNLPGNPAAVTQCQSAILPVLPHAISMLRK